LGLRHARRGILLAVIALAWTAACDSDKEVFTPTGTIRVSVVDRSLVTQSAEPRGNQVTVWALDAVQLDVAGFGLFDYKATAATCDQQQFSPAIIVPVRCGVLGYAFEPDQPLAVSMRLRISEMQVRRAARPVLPPEGDFDGDDKRNDIDNCVLIDNPGQQDVNGDGFGNACSLPNVIGDPTIPDRDGDGVADGAPDNCLWIKNPMQEDSSSPKDGIGDACALSTQVDLGGPLLELVLELPEPLLSIEGAQTSISADFGPALVNCDLESMTPCVLGAVEITTP